MKETGRLRVVIIKPSKYLRDGYVERYRRTIIPNATAPYIHSLTPTHIDSCKIETVTFDENFETDLHYLDLLRDRGTSTLLALVGVQSHQFHRALDLAALAREEGGALSVIGGPHAMTCDTSDAQGIDGISFALSEAELIWPEILKDAIGGSLKLIYGQDGRWQKTLDPPPLMAPSARELKRSLYRLISVYPARGCPYKCSFCSVIKIAGRAIRSQPVETTLESLRRAKDAGARMVMFTSDNFNKYPDAPELLEAMIAENLQLPFFVQCDTQVAKQPELIKLMGRAGCFMVLLGVESFDVAALRGVGKNHNRLEHYETIIQQCREARILTLFSNILGFPEDTLDSIDAHMTRLCEMSPDFATFYILTPLPGTEQYDDFRTEGLITEPNLDRYDATNLTWAHPHLTARELDDNMYRCFHRFHSARHIAGAVRRWGFGRDFRAHAHRMAGIVGPAIFHVLGKVKTHPGFGGVVRVRRDHLSDYRERRRRVFGFELAPLPDSLALSAGDQAINRRAKLIATNAV